MTTSEYVFNISGKSYPFSQLDATTLVSSASGTWQGHGWSGSGTWYANYYFQIDSAGHIIALLPDSVFVISGQWNVN